MEYQFQSSLQNHIWVKVLTLFWAYDTNGHRVFIMISIHPPISSDEPPTPYLRKASHTSEDATSQMWDTLLWSIMWYPNKGTKVNASDIEQCSKVKEVVMPQEDTVYHLGPKCSWIIPFYIRRDHEHGINPLNLLCLMFFSLKSNF